MRNDRYVDINIPEAQIYADLFGIEADLSDVIRICDRLISEGAHILDVEALNIAALVKYSRCFSSGVRKSINFDDVRDITDDDKALHDYFINVRNKYIAHSVNAFETNTVIIFLNPEEEGKKLLDISGQHRRVSSLSRTEISKLKSLSHSLMRYVDDLKQEEEKNIRKILRDKPIDEFYSRAANPLPRIKNSDAYKKRKTFDL